ncbi:metallophosphoesterase [Pseudoduganella danionis]|uniref:metallophosphoesterase family protein n=1 Tax=Pseudoduganella danionis TaxID=1890295 RepID=UPI0035B0084E
MARLISRAALAVVAGLLCCASSQAAERHAARRPAADPVLFSFATVGDSRTDAALATTAQDRLYLQNTQALARIVREISQQHPQALFFNGDMIMGYTTDAVEIARQYAYWRGMLAGLMETGTYVVPVPGNHEMQFKSKDGQGRVTKTAMPDNEQHWRASMGDLILDAARWQAVTGLPLQAYDADNTPQAGSADGNRTSQSQLTYSFDVAGSHFAVINTDPVGNDGHAPVHWLAQDFQRARERGMRHFFVFGHKPAYTYRFRAGVEADGMDIYPQHAQAFWQLMEDYGASYFCGHQHIFNAQQPALASGGKAWQVMVGSGGSPFSAKAGDGHGPTDRMYAWALVQVHASGRVQVTIRGFDDSYGPSRTLQTLRY